MFVDIWGDCQIRRREPHHQGPLGRAVVATTGGRAPTPAHTPAARPWADTSSRRRCRH